MKLSARDDESLALAERETGRTIEVIKVFELDYIQSLGVDRLAKSQHELVVDLTRSRHEPAAPMIAHEGFVVPFGPHLHTPTGDQFKAQVLKFNRGTGFVQNCSNRLWGESVIVDENVDTHQVLDR